MPDNNDHDTAFVKVVTCSSSNQKEEMLLQRDHVSLVASGTCFVNFDKPVTAGGRYQLVQNVPVDFPVKFSQLNFKADSGTPTIHIMASRNK